MQRGKKTKISKGQKFSFVDHRGRKIFGPLQPGMRVALPVHTSVEDFRNGGPHGLRTVTVSRTPSLEKYV